MSRLSLFVASGLLLVVASGCVKRKLTVTSEPSGALVTLNGQEAGRTPFTTDFRWYGFYDVEVRREGSKTLITRERIIAPWWQWVPFDLMAELVPGATDRQSMHFKLEPADAKPDTKGLISRGLDFRAQTNAGLPATQPAK
jgi:hypothetical protein